ncbi:RING finger protein unkempt [Araneus ventricosus]|uniref:RING finger protein unkempt n=1 Tax=Araneus ventricosus TaxID=182803 RepID=A0A4Y2RFZ9_ARAVE|nr:RING finger protein unkempt [Araneus ventricosus]
MPSSSEGIVNNASGETYSLHVFEEFRVEQCLLFLQHKCTQHKPFTCFYWHFMNQRRRRAVRRRDGTFNYSPDVYCSKYDETTGICPDGDYCSYLHRTAGDTERRYHLRYYKTGVCVRDTDSRGPNHLYKERNALNEDSKWQDTNYVLANYETEQCKRLLGYACPSFHNIRDHGRSPKKCKYRSTPCPNVKQADEWGDPANCENGDSCPYCHTRTEQQFHPEIYKSTKLMIFYKLATAQEVHFVHFLMWAVKQISAVRDLGDNHSTDLAAILSNALPNVTRTHLCENQEDTTDEKLDLVNDGIEQQSSNRNTNSLPEVQSNAVDHYPSSNHPLPNPISRPPSYSSSTNHFGESMPHYPKAPGSEREDREVGVKLRQLQAIDDDPNLEPYEKAHRKQSIYLGCDSSLSHLSGSLKTISPLATSFYPAADTVESVVGR